MINAGAILVCSLLKTVAGPEMTLAEKFDYTLNCFAVSPVNCAIIIELAPVINKQLVS